MAIDHVIPLRRMDTDKELESYGITRGTDAIENLLPSCKSCNSIKGSLTIDNFRASIASSTDQLAKYTTKYHTALKYGLITETNKPVVFYFEHT